MSNFNVNVSLDPAGLAPLYFRHADRLRLEGCVAGLLRDGRSLALSSNREAALDHYSRLLFARLRESSPSSQLEVYFPADTAAMLARFNEVLATQSVEQAMKVSGTESVARIMIVHDAGALADHEVQLLARLVQNFPGANIRIVLLLGTSARSRKIFESFDRRMLRWDIEAPTPEQAETMLAQGREDGCEGVVRALLQKMQAPEPGEMVQADPAGIDPLGFDAPGARSPASTDVFTFSGGATKGRAETDGKPAESKNRKSRSGFFRWFLAVSALAVLSVGITAWLHPDVFNLDRLQMAQRWVRSTLQSASPPATVIAPAPGAGATVAQTPPAAPADAAPPVEPPAVPAASAPAAGAPEAPVATLPPVAATDTTLAAKAPPAQVQPAPATPANPPAPPASLKPAKIAPGAATAPALAESIEAPADALAAQAWLKPMPFGTFVVQHAAMPTYQAALQWQKGQPALTAARVVALYRPNQKMAYFAVVSGPFTSRALAAEFTKSRGVPPDAWVRSARSLREQFTPELASAGKRQETRP
jgi:hypothetical protein